MDNTVGAYLWTKNFGHWTTARRAVKLGNQIDDFVRGVRALLFEAELIAEPVHKDDQARETRTFLVTGVG